MKKIVFALISLVLLGCSSAKKNNLHMNTELSVKQMKKDIKYVERKLFNMHPDVDLYISKENLHKKFDSLTNTITEPLKPNDFYLKIAPIIASVRQGHMNLSLLGQQIEKSQKKIYKGSKNPLTQFNFIWDNEELYVLKNESKNEEPKAGSKIIAINNITPQQIFKKYRNTITSDGYNETFVNKWFEKKINSLYTNELGALDSIQIKFSCNDSISIAKINRIFKGSKIANNVDKKTDSLQKPKSDSLLANKKVITKAERKLNKKLLKQNSDSLFEKRSIYGYDYKNKNYKISLSYPTETDSLAVLKIRSFSDSKYKKAYPLIFKEMKDKNIKYLVLDLRGNPGGRLSEIESLYSYLTKEEDYVFLNPTKVTSKWKLPIYLISGQSVLNYIVYSPFYIVYSTVVLAKTSKNADGNFYYKMKGEKPRKREANYFNGDLYVLTDGMSFSAASIISSNLKGTKRAYFVGNETGGDYNGTVAGRLPILTLPNSKLKWRIGLMNIKPKEQSEIIGHGIYPDYEIIPNAEQIINQDDIEMNWIFTKINQQ